MTLELRKARPEDYPALQQLLELYQYELFDIWPQDADAEAKYRYSFAPQEGQASPRRAEQFRVT